MGLQANLKLVLKMYHMHLLTKGSISKQQGKSGRYQDGPHGSW